MVPGCGCGSPLTPVLPCAGPSLTMSKAAMPPPPRRVIVMPARSRSSYMGLCCASMPTGKPCMPASPWLWCGAPRGSRMPVAIQVCRRMQAAWAIAPVAWWASPA
eukprot:364695-Chlamydomonas_euryale.AAC.7